MPTILRRSQRARTPTHYFHSELPRHRRRTPTPQPQDISNEPGEEEEGKESGSLRAPEKEVEKKTAVSEAVEMPTPYALRSASARHPIAPSAALSSDEETAGIGGSELESTAVTPRISLYESKVRKRLNELSEMTKKSLSEAISAKTKAGQQQQKQQEQQQPSDKDMQSTRTFVPSPPMTRSRALQARQTLTVQPSTTYARTKLREQQDGEKKDTKRKREGEGKEPEAKIEQEKEGDEEDGAADELSSVVHPQPTEDLSTQEEHLLPQPPQTADQGQAEPYQWMQLGWEEVTFTFVVLALMIFAYYCFYSESC